MKYILISSVLFLVLLDSCNKNRLRDYEGTWQPIFDNGCLISKIQFMRLENFYIAGIEYRGIGSGFTFFYTCEENHNSLSIYPDKFLSRNFEEHALTTKATFYFDPEFKNLYSQNTVFKLCPEKLFQFVSGELKLVPKK